MLLDLGVGAVTFLRPKGAWAAEHWPGFPSAGDLDRLADDVRSFLEAKPPLRLYVDTALRGEWARLGLLDDPEPEVLGCGGAQRHVAVSPEGDVYPCSHQRRPEYRLGNLLTDDLERLWSKGSGLAGRQRYLATAGGSAAEPSAPRLQRRNAPEYRRREDDFVRDAETHMDQPAVTSSVDRFDLEYPEELPDGSSGWRAVWPTDRRHLVRLLGLPRDKVAALEGQSWRDITTRFEPQAERLEHVLTHYLSYWKYDSEEAARFTEGFPGRVRTGEFDLDTLIPLYTADASPVERSGRWSLLSSQTGAPPLCPAGFPYPARRRRVTSASHALPRKPEPVRPPDDLPTPSPSALLPCDGDRAEVADVLRARVRCTSHRPATATTWCSGGRLRLG